MIHLLALLPDGPVAAPAGTRALAAGTGAVLVEDVAAPPDAERPELTEPQLARIWAALCEIASARTVVAMRFGQVVPGDADAATLAATLLRRLPVPVCHLADWRLSARLDAGGESQPRGAAFLAARKARADAEARLQTGLEGCLAALPGVTVVDPARRLRDRVEARLRVDMAARDEAFATLERESARRGWRVSARGPEPLLGGLDLDSRIADHA